MKPSRLNATDWREEAHCGIRVAIFGVNRIAGAAALGLALALSVAGSAQETSTQDEIAPQPAREEAVEENSDVSPSGEAEVRGTEPAPEPTESDEPAIGQDQVGEHTVNRESPRGVLFGDGVAQWLMMLAAFLTVGVSVWAVLLLRGTLKATRDTLTEAENATKAAIAAVHSERAWMSIIPYDLAEVEETVVDGVLVRHSIGVRMNWMNAGRSPALQTQVVVKKEIIGPDEAVPEFISVPPESATHGIPLGPGVKVPTQWVFLTDTELQSIWNGPNRLIIFTRADYKTAFDPNRWRHSQATVEFEIHTLPTDEWDLKTLRHSVTHVGEQNTAD